MLQITDPYISKEKEIAIGIDFGTTSSVISYCDTDDKTNVKFLEDDLGNILIPSVISFEKGQVKVGHTAYEDKNPIISIKRLLGQNDFFAISGYKLIHESDDIYIIDHKTEKKYSLTFLVAQIFLYLKGMIEKKFKEKIIKCVMTIPARFDEYARQKILSAAKIANLFIIKLISEPTAASIVYGIQNMGNGHIAVMDFGGGTFDISVIKLQNNIIRVIKTSGDLFLGGDDIDRLIYEKWLQAEGDIVLAKKIKTHISIHGYYIDRKGKNYTEADLIKLSKPVFDKIKKVVTNVLDETEKKDIKIDKVLLAGGSCNIPYIKTLAQKLFKIVAEKYENPELLISKGAMMHANDILYDRRHLLIDVVPLSFGIENYYGSVDYIIYKNTSMPTHKEIYYTTSKDYQTSIKINIVQGEENDIKKVRSIGQFDLTNITKQKAGKAKIKIAFEVDSNGILTVSATDISNGSSKKITINVIDQKKAAS